MHLIFHDLFIRFLMMFFVSIFNESDDLKHSTIDLVFEFRKMDLLFFNERKGFRVVEKLLHLAVNIVLVLN